LLSRAETDTDIYAWHRKHWRGRCLHAATARLGAGATTATVTPADREGVATQHQCTCSRDKLLPLRVRRARRLRQGRTTRCRAAAASLAQACGTPCERLVQKEIHQTQCAVNL